MTSVKKRYTIETQETMPFYKWIDVDKITDVVVDFKFNVYKELKDKIKKIIN